MRRVDRARLVGLCVMVGVVAGCSSGSSKAAPATTTTRPRPTTSTSIASTTTTESSTTTSPSTTSTTTPAPRKAASPDAAAQRLFADWQAATPADTSEYANQQAVDQIFAQPVGSPVPDFQGCFASGGDGATCDWRYEGGGLVMRVQGDADGWLVESVSFVAA